MLRLLHVDYQKDHKHSGLNNVSFSIGKGEILGVAGVDGNGQSQLAQLVTGVIAPDGGRSRLKFPQGCPVCAKWLYPFQRVPCSGGPEQNGAGRKYDSRRKSGFKGHGRTSFFLCTRRFIKEKAIRKFALELQKRMISAVLLLSRKQETYPAAISRRSS